jgi:hypothetical protein
MAKPVKRGRCESHHQEERAYDKTCREEVTKKKTKAAEELTASAKLAEQHQQEEEKEVMFSPSSPAPTMQNLQSRSPNHWAGLAFLGIVSEAGEGSFGSLLTLVRKIPTRAGTFRKN